MTDPKLAEAMEIWKRALSAFAPSKIVYAPGTHDAAAQVIAAALAEKDAVIEGLVGALSWFPANLRVKAEDGTGSQYGRASLWEGPEQAQLCLCMAASSYSLASVGAIDSALRRAEAALSKITENTYEP